jgi:hypothetical protein
MIIAQSKAQPNNQALWQEPLSDPMWIRDDETRSLARRIIALQNAPSPASLPLDRFAGRPDGVITERLFDALAAAKVLTSQVAMHLDPTWRTRLFRQLDSLHDIEEWEEGDLPLRSASYQTFLKGMLALDPQRRPGLGLSSGGNLIAAWTTGDDRLTIEFLPDDQARWVISRRGVDGPARYAGHEPVSSLPDSLAKHGSLRWFTHAP